MEVPLAPKPKRQKCMEPSSDTVGIKAQASRQFRLQQRFETHQQIPQTLQQSHLQIPQQSRESLLQTVQLSREFHLQTVQQPLDILVDSALTHSRPLGDSFHYLLSQGVYSPHTVRFVDLSLLQNSADPSILPNNVNSSLPPNCVDYSLSSNNINSSFPSSWAPVSHSVMWIGSKTATCVSLAILIEANSLIQLTQSQSLSSYVASVRKAMMDRFNACPVLFLVVEGLQKRLEQPSRLQYRQALLHCPSSTPSCKRKRNHLATVLEEHVEVNRRLLELEIIGVELEHKSHVVHTKDAIQSAQWVLSMTKQLVALPFQ